MSAGFEVERKYLLSALPPEVAKHKSTEIDQGYLPGQEIRERVRRKVSPDSTRYVRTIKAGRGLARIEVEEDITRELFEALWALTEGSRLKKRRHFVPDGALMWEIDEFLDRNLVLAELELPNREIQVAIPGWLAPYVVREVTNESGFVNQNLAR